MQTTYRQREVRGGETTYRGTRRRDGPSGEKVVVDWSYLRDIGTESALKDTTERYALDRRRLKTD
jgi:hypothetical protein